MSQVISVLRAPYDFLFGENGVFASHGERREQQKALYLGLPAVAFAVLGGLFLTVGELRAGKDLQENYKGRIKDAQEARLKVNKEVSREARVRAANFPPGTPLNEIIPEDDPRRDEVKELIKDEETYLKKLISLSPEEAEHFFNLAKLYIQKGESEQGLAMMKQLAPLDAPGYVNAHLFLAEAYQQVKVSSNRDRQRLLGLADSHLDRALVREENNLTAIKMKSQLMMQIKNYEQARKYFEMFFVQEPRVYTALCDLIDKTDRSNDAKLAVLHSARSRFQEQLNRLKTHSVERLQLLSLLTDCLHRLKDFDQADAVVLDELRLISVDPQKAEELGVKGWGNRILAISKYLRYLELGNPNEVLASNAEEKIRLLEEGFELDPSNPNILRTLTQLQGSKVPGVKEKVTSIYDARKRSDSIAEVDNVLGIVALAEGRYRNAFEYFERACKKAPSNPGYLNNRAYTRMKDAELQLELATKAVQEQGEDATEEKEKALSDAKKNLVSAAVKAVSDVDRAIRNLQASNAATQFLTNYFDTKGHALMMQGKYNMAAAEFLRASVGRPNDLGITEAIRDCYQKDGQLERAKIWAQRYQQLLAQAKN